MKKTVTQNANYVVLAPVIPFPIPASVSPAGMRLTSREASDRVTWLFVNSRDGVIVKHRLHQVKYTASTRATTRTQLYRIAYEVYIAYEYTRSTARLNEARILTLKALESTYFQARFRTKLLLYIYGCYIVQERFYLGFEMENCNCLLLHFVWREDPVVGKLEDRLSKNIGVCSS